MRVGLVRSVALGMVALVGFAGCDDNPTDFDTSDTASITTNPSAMTVNAEDTSLLDSRTINAGDEPTWEEISATVDGSCGHSDISVATAATFEPSIQPPGQFDVTGGTTVGESCIDLSGGGASATVEVTVVPDSLDITNVPETDIVVFSTVQLGGALLGDAGGTVSPFDFGADVAWATDDEAVATVDETGLLTAEGAGSATITATWTGLGVSRTYEFPVNVIVPAPVLSSTDVASAELSEMVTITGTGFIPGAHVILLDGVEADPFWSPTIVDETTATFVMPGGVPGDVEITVGVPGDLSNALTVSRVCGTADESCASEPGNDSADGAPTVVMPVSFSGYANGVDAWDILTFTLAAETTFDASLSWTGTSGDMDAVFSLDGVPGYGAPECGFIMATAGVPESGTCTLAAGTYFVWIFSYDGGIGIYDLELTPVVP